MFDAERDALRAVQDLVATMDGRPIRGEDARRLVGVFTRIERVAAAGRTIAAGHVASAKAWQRAGHRTAAAWLASEADLPIGKAVATLETAARLDALPRTTHAFRAGDISEARASEIASVAPRSPATEAELVELARAGSMNALKERCRAVRTADGRDESARYDLIRRSRYFRSWTEADGAVRLDARLTPDDGAAVLAAVEARKDQIFNDARRADRREPYRAYAADALVSLVCENQRPGARGPRATVHVRVDHAALLRGHAAQGEMCEIPGVGAIPVATARALAADSILKVLVTDGADVRVVAHAGRTIPTRLRSALEARDPTCVVPGCEISRGLQIDHRIPFAAGGPTTLENLNRLCRWHHHLKTHCGYRLEGRPGTWHWLTPDDQQGQDARPPPAA